MKILLVHTRRPFVRVPEVATAAAGLRDALDPSGVEVDLLELPVLCDDPATQARNLLGLTCFDLGHSSTHTPIDRLLALDPFALLPEHPNKLLWAVVGRSRPVGAEAASLLRARLRGWGEQAELEAAAPDAGIFATTGEIAGEIEGLAGLCPAVLPMPGAPISATAGSGSGNEPPCPSTTTTTTTTTSASASGAAWREVALRLGLLPDPRMGEDLRARQETPAGEGVAG